VKFPVRLHDIDAKIRPKERKYLLFYPLRSKASFDTQNC